MSSNEKRKMAEMNKPASGGFLFALMDHDKTFSSTTRGSTAGFERAKAFGNVQKCLHGLRFDKITASFYG